MPKHLKTQQIRVGEKRVSLHKDESSMATHSVNPGFNGTGSRPQCFSRHFQVCFRFSHGKIIRKGPNLRMTEKYLCFHENVVLNLRLDEKHIVAWMKLPIFHDREWLIFWGSTEQPSILDMSSDQTLVIFHCTGGLIGILILAYYDPYKCVV